MDGIEKIPISLVFSKLVLDSVKVKILLITWHFLEFFFVAPPPTHSLTPLFFGILKVFRWCISGTSFIYVWFAVHKFWNFKCFHTSRKYNFRLLLVSIFGRNPPKCGQIHLKFRPVMQCNIMHQACDSFSFILKKTWKWAKKGFSGSFWEVFGLLFFMLYELHPNL